MAIPYQAPYLASEAPVGSDRSSDARRSDADTKAQDFPLMMASVQEPTGDIASQEVLEVEEWWGAAAPKH